MIPVMYLCPRAWLHTHVMLPRREPSDDSESFDLVRCLACNESHLDPAERSSTEPARLAAR